MFKAPSNGLLILCIQYGSYAKISCRNLRGPSLPRSTLFCFGLVLSNHIAGKMYLEMDIRRTEHNCLFTEEDTKQRLAKTIDWK